MRMAAKCVRKGKLMVDGLRKNLDELTRTAELDGLRAIMIDLRKKHPLSRLEGAKSPAPSRPRSPLG